ncbi:MAG TPA: hypothetical protein VF166_13325 [Gemmatimonadaceae bacterium]
MPTFFPIQAIEWHLHEPKALRRLSLSLVGMATVAAVILHAVWWTVRAYGTGHALWLVPVGILVRVIILLAFATGHLGNFPIRQWLWRAPMFAIVASAAETAISAVLIAFGWERLGTQYEHWHDLPSRAAALLIGHLVLVILFAIVLAGVVQMARFTLLKHEHRESTAMAIHEEHLRQTQESESAE